MATNHSKWLSCVAIDIQPHMAELIDPAVENSPTILAKAVELLRTWLTLRLIHFPDDMLCLQLLGFPEGANHGSTSSSLQYSSFIDNGIGMDAISTSLLDLLGGIEPAETSCQLDIRGAITTGSELIWERYCINKRLQFGKQIVLFTSILNNPSIRSVDFQSQYRKHVELCLERKHIINAFVHGAKTIHLSSVPDPNNKTLYDLCPKKHSNEQRYLSYWLRACDEYTENGSWQRYDYEQSEWISDKTRPPYLVAELPELTRWRDAGLSREALTYALYYDINLKSLEETLDDETKDKLLNIAEKELVLRCIVKSTGGTFHSFESGEIELDGPFYKEKKVITKYSGKLFLGSTQHVPMIDISAYTLTMQAKLPTLSSWNKNADRGGIPNTPDGIDEHISQHPDWKPGQKSETTSAERLTRIREYFDDQQNVLDKTTLLEGWRYGKEDVIVMEHEDLLPLISNTTKSIQVIRAVKMDSIHPWIRCDSVDYFQGHKDHLPAQLSINTLASYCHNQRLVLLVRYVKRDNAQPIIGYLWPILNSDPVANAVDQYNQQNGCVNSDGTVAAGFFFNRLPLRDDVREYSHPRAYIPLTDDEVNSWKQWYDSYTKRYLKKHTEDYNESVAHAKKINKRPQFASFDEYIENQWVESYLQQIEDITQPVSMDNEPGMENRNEDGSNNDDNGSGGQNNDQTIHLLNPIWLNEDYKDVVENNRWAIRNRTPMGFNSGYINPLSNNVLLQTAPFWGYSESTLTKTQQVLKNISDNLLLPLDYNPTEIRSPGLNRYYGAVRDRLLDQNAQIADSIRYVENSLLPPIPPTPQEIIESIDPNDPDAHQQAVQSHFDGILVALKDNLSILRENRPVEIQQAVYDSRGRKQYTNPLAESVSAVYGSNNGSNNNGDYMNDLYGNNDQAYGLPGNEVGVKDETFAHLNDQPKLEQTIDPRTLGIVINTPWAGTTEVGEDNPTKDALKMIIRGRVDEAVNGLATIVSRLFFQGATDPEKIPTKQARNRALGALQALREHCLEEERPNVYNQCVLGLADWAQQHDRLVYLQMQQYHTQLYPGQPIKHDSNGKSYVIHPQIANNQYDLEKLYPITEDTVSQSRGFAQYWFDIIVKQYQDDLLLVDSDECRVSKINREEKRLPFHPDVVLAGWKSYDEELVQKLKEKMTDGGNSGSVDSDEFDLASYEQEQQQLGQQQIVGQQQEQYNWDNGDDADDWDPENNFD